MPRQIVEASILMLDRSHYFYYIFSAFYVAELIASFTASVTTDISPWIPCTLAMASVILCILLLAVMPESRKTYCSPQATPPESHMQDGGGIRLSPNANGILSALKTPKILLTIPVFLVGIYRYTILGLLIGYASYRFQMKISRGAIFFTEAAFVNIFLFLFLIPQLSSHLRRKYLVRPEVIDLFLVRTSVSLMSVGTLLIGISPSFNLLPIGQ